MSDKKINLEEILYKHYNLMFAAYSVKDKDNKFTPVVDRNGALNAMKEACRQALELAAENAKLKTVKLSEGVAGVILPTWKDTINKQSILNTINEIE